MHAEIHASMKNTHFVFKIFQTMVTSTTGNTATMMMAAKELDGI